MKTIYAVSTESIKLRETSRYGRYHMQENDDFVTFTSSDIAKLFKSLSNFYENDLAAYQEVSKRHVVADSRWINPKVLESPIIFILEVGEDKTIRVKGVDAKADISKQTKNIQDYSFLDNLCKNLSIDTLKVIPHIKQPEIPSPIYTQIPQFS